MPLISEIETGDRIRLDAVFGLVERIVHYGGAFDVRIAIRRADGSMSWHPANYSDSCKRLRGPVRPEPVEVAQGYGDVRDRPMAGR